MTMTLPARPVFANRIPGDAHPIFKAIASAWQGVVTLYGKPTIDYDCDILVEFADRGYHSVSLPEGEGEPVRFVFDECARDDTWQGNYAASHECAHLLIASGRPSVLEEAICMSYCTLYSAAVLTPLCHNGPPISKTICWSDARNEALSQFRGFDITPEQIRSLRREYPRLDMKPDALLQAIPQLNEAPEPKQVARFFCQLFSSLELENEREYKKCPRDREKLAAM